jgi:hypothetical protein
LPSSLKENPVNKKRIAVLFFAAIAVFAATANLAWSQTAESAQSASVPRLVQFAGTLRDAAARPVSGVASVTFAIYAEQDGGVSLWSETQNVSADAGGHYNATLGSATAGGVPEELFGTGQSRWLGVQIARQAELPRVLLVSVPYALKAADADTLGGLPASAFVTMQSVAATKPAASETNTAVIAATAPQASSQMAPQTSASGVTPDVTLSGSGTAGYLPLWTTSSNLGSSGIFQASNGFIGIDTTTPATGVDVANNMIVRGGFTMPPEGTATASKSYTSHSYYFQASAFNSAKNSAELQNFQWQANPVGSNTAAPSGFLGLRFAEGTAASVSTGFGIASNGILSFAPGQTFPGVPELGTTNTFTGNETFNGQVQLTSGSVYGLYATSTSTEPDTAAIVGVGGAVGGFGVEGTGPGIGVYGFSLFPSNLGGILHVGQAGVWADSGGPAGGSYFGLLATTDDNSAAGIYNSSQYSTLLTTNFGSGNAITATATGEKGFAVMGQSDYVGILGIGNQAGNFSSIGLSTTRNHGGVWGDAGTEGISTGVLGTADDNNAAVFLNNSNDYPTLLVFNFGTAGFGAAVLEAKGAFGTCTMNNGGDLGCTGKVTTSSTVDNGARQVALYSVQSPENWFEDFGSGTLSNGAATVTLDSTFTQTVNTGMTYHVFLTPKGDSEGLYVSNETPQGFEVREQRGGRSSVAFDYRIVAKRVGFESVRLADITAQTKKLAATRKTGHPPARPAIQPKLRSGALAKPSSAAKPAAQPSLTRPKP